MTKTGRNLKLGHELFLEIAAGACDEAYGVELVVQGAALNVANAEGITTLMSAAAEGHGKIVEAMLKSGRDVALNAQDDHGWTALITAVHRDKPGIVKLLLDAGADVGVKDKMERDVFYYGTANVHALLMYAAARNELLRGATATENPVTPMRPLKLKIP
ncbi:MAG: ankyrin repeat domain-containing protein [Alphaproteobacteria bacterium]